MKCFSHFLNKNFKQMLAPAPALMVAYGFLSFCWLDKKKKKSSEDINLASDQLVMSVFLFIF